MVQPDRKSASILIVDDVPDNIRLLGKVLGSDYRILVATNGDSALKVAEEEHPDIILLDIMMPDMDGYEVFRCLRASPITERIPVIFVTAMDQIENEEMALELGAIDYLTKPINPVITKLRVKNQLELKRYRDFLAEQSQTDGLTGIPNRRRFDDEVAKEWRLVVRGETQISLIMIDIDYFKQFNDTYGHQEGDRCLRDVALAMQACLVRGTDLLARYGGEEFVCLLPETDLEGTKLIGERFRQAVLDLEIPHIKSEISDFVTISLGAASLFPTPEMEESTLIAEADKALYEAKAQGRNRVVGTS